MTAEPILIWGAGAIGGTIAAHLAARGRDVVVVDANAAHVDAINSRGLTITGPEGTFTARLAARRPDEVTGTFRLIFLAVKAHHTEPAARQLLPHLAADGTVLSLQNGLCETVIAEIVGAPRTVGAFINFGADYLEPGKLSLGTRAAVVVGEIDGEERARTREIHDILRVFEPKALLTGNIWGYLWGKTAYAALLKAEAVSDLTIADFIRHPALRELNLKLVRELLAVARAEGVTPLGFDGFEPDAFLGPDDAPAHACLERIAAFWGASGKPYSSPWRDIAVLKLKTDAGAQLAPVLAIAERHGLAVPITRKLIALIARLEDGEAKQGPALVDELVAAARQA
jgi:2-dehydropantoate 2-reductase